MLRAEFAESMKKHMYKSFYEGEQYDKYEPKYKELFKAEKSTAAYEKSTSIIGEGVLEETTEGQDAPVREVKEGWTTLGKNRSFKERLIITKENQDDLQQVKDILKKKAYNWGNMWETTKDELAAKFFNYGSIAAGDAVFNNAIPNVVSDSTGNLCFDSKALFNLTGDARTTKAGNTYYNHGGALSLTATNFKTMYNLMAVTNSYNEDGEKISLKPDTLLIPPALHFTADVLINSTLVPGSGNNDKNSLKGIVNVVEWDKLTDADGWFLICKGKGIVFQDRMGIEIDFFEDKRSKNWEATCMGRAGVRVDNWRFVTAANTSTT
jgi:hypothetical protein